MSIYAIGDIHGCYNALTSLFTIIPKSSLDTFVFLGDYVDRGPNTKDTLEWLINFGRNHKAFFLRGNHDVMLMEAHKNRKKLNEWLLFGGEQTLASYQTNASQNWGKSLPETHWNFLENTKLYIELDNFVFVHAGLESGKNLKTQSHDTLLWNKNLTPKQFLPTKKVICGHTARKNGKIANFGHTICIDTCVYGGQWLTCLNIDTGEFYQANEQKATKTGILK